MHGDYSITSDLPIHLRHQAAAIFYQAFAPKIDHLLLKPKSPQQAIRIYEACINFNAGFYALHRGEVVGLAGLQYRNLKFDKLTWSSLIKEFGFWGTVYRMALLFVSNRILSPLDKDEIRIESLAVAEGMRGKQIGTSLLNTVFEFARSNGFNTVSLEVVDTNQRARQLYERLGFIPVKTTKYGRFTRRAGFSADIKMIRPLL